MKFFFFVHNLLLRITSLLLDRSQIFLNSRSIFKSTFLNRKSRQPLTAQYKFDKRLLIRITTSTADLGFRQFW